MTAQTPSGRGFARQEFLQAPFDLIGIDGVLSILSERKAGDPFAYVVTPNVDHVVRLARRPELAPAYRAAWMSWCDSQPLRALARLVGLRLPHLNGTDVTSRIFHEVLRPADRVVCITADDALLDELRARFPQYEFAGYSPPHGFEDMPAEMAACLRFIREHSARFIFIGVGSPRSERLAYEVERAGGATGTAFCIGAALEFLAGRKRRAPGAMQAMGLEWLHRLATEPRRLWRRYAFAVAPLCILFAREIATRRRA